MCGLLGPAAAPGGRSFLVCRRAGYRMRTAASVFVAPPGEDRGTATALRFGSGFRGSASGALVWLKVSGAGLTDLKAQAPEPFLLRRVPSHLLAEHRTAFLKYPTHSREPEFVAWDCKVTPASCACQEGNTIGCIPSNDGAGAGFRAGFPHCGKTKDPMILSNWSDFPFLGLGSTARLGLPRIDSEVQSPLRK